VPAASPATGWPLYEVKAEGFALELPPDWRQIDMNPATFETKMKELMKQNPQLEPMMANLRQLLAAGFKFYGLESATIGKGFTTNVNVIKQRLPAGATLDAGVADAVRQLEGLPTVAKPVVRERVQMPAGECERLRVKMTMQAPSGQAVALATTQYLFVKGGDVYSLTFSTLQDREAGYAPTFEKIAQSFRFIP
jgi:hypothetical protein